MTGEKRATVHDLARVAGVSLATIDRVLNNRPGVRQATIEKVQKTIQELDFQRDVTASLLARRQDLRVVFLLPDGQNLFMQNLAGQIDFQKKIWAGKRVQIEVKLVPTLDGGALAQSLDVLDIKSCDYAVIVATDTAEVRKAVDDAMGRGVTVLTLVSDLPGTRRQNFIGIDNYAAGKTAASLLGRFCAHQSKIGLLIGSHDLRDHRQRMEGFKDVLDEEFSHLNILPAIEGHDHTQTAQEAVTSLLEQHPDLAGIYSAGAGNSGLLAAVNAREAGGKVRIVVHELTDATSRGLNEGVIDIVLDQDPAGEIAAVLGCIEKMSANALTPTPASPSYANTTPIEPVSLRIFMRDNVQH